MSEHPMRTAGILIFDDVEVLDFCGPFEVFSVISSPASTATRLLNGRRGAWSTIGGASRHRARRISQGKPEKLAASTCSPS